MRYLGTMLWVLIVNLQVCLVQAGGKSELTFCSLLTDNAGANGIPQGKSLQTFWIAGKDKKFVPAEAKIDGDTVVVSSDKAPAPAHVRYCWLANGANGNLINKEGLPALPFATDMLGK